ncbi:hypothetical protein [Zavarzinella formosa]|uniref:hypothetical protein n=1 Tax=Zavarzinella formosa TaxID=360055 RepID=UPI0002E78EA5|nr:hypothetical protein [Zavarzinella formosa]
MAACNVLEVNDFDSIESLMVDATIREAREKLGCKATLKHGNPNDPYVITAVLIRLEDKGYSEAVEISQVRHDSMNGSTTERIICDSIMLTIYPPEHPEPTEEDDDFGGIKTIPEDNAEATVVIPKEELPMAVALTPLEELEAAVTAHEKLERTLPDLINAALPVGLPVRCRNYGSGVVSSPTGPDEGDTVHIQIDEGQAHAGETRWTSARHISIGGHCLDTNYIPF